jgi:hypothetical protein
MRCMIVILTVLASLFSAAPALAEDAARAIVERGIKAQGGPEALAKAKMVRIVSEGTASFIPNTPQAPVKVEELYSRPEKYKSTISMQVQGMNLSFVQAVNGDEAWMSVNGMLIPLPPEGEKEMKAQLHTDQVTSLTFLGNLQAELSLADEVVIDGKPAVGVLVKSAGQRDVTLYFDKESGLLVKATFKANIPTQGETDQEVLFSDYQDQNGLKLPRKVVVLQGGRKIVETKVVKVELLDKVDDKEFAKP